MRLSKGAVYKISKLLREYESRLKFVGVEGSCTPPRPFEDIDGALESMYLDNDVLEAVKWKLEGLLSVLELNLSDERRKEVLKVLFDLLGYKFNP